MRAANNVLPSLGTKADYSRLEKHWNLTVNGFNNGDLSPKNL